MALQSTFRDTFQAALPWWLKGPIGSRLVWAVGLVLDTLAEMLVSGVRKRFPGAEGDDSLGLIGRERRIRRGPNEPGSIYALRLRRWLDDHRRRGGPYALLDQVGAFYSQSPFPITLMYASGRRFDRAVDGTVTIVDGPAFGDGAAWNHWWLIYQWPTVIGDDGLWDDPGDWEYDEDSPAFDAFTAGTWDTDLSVATVREIRLVPSEWNAAHTFGHVILLCPGGAIWDFPAELWDDPGNWQDAAEVTVTLDLDQ